jgi:hypothetical protein
MKTMGIVLAAVMAFGLNGCKSDADKRVERMDEARRALAAGDLDKADREFSAVLEEDGSIAEAIAGRAEVMLRRADALGAFRLASECGVDVCEDIKQKAERLLRKELEAKPVTEVAARNYVATVQALDGEQCGLLQALNRAKADDLPNDSALHRAVEVAVRALRVEAPDTEEATLDGSEVARASGELAAHDADSCEAAGRELSKMYGQLRMIRSIATGASQMDPPSSRELRDSERQSRIFWYFLLKTRLQPEQADAGADDQTDAAADPKTADRWPPEGPGCDRLMRCQEQLSRPASNVVRLVYPKHNSCGPALVEVRRRIQATGLELPAACK